MSQWTLENDEEIAELKDAAHYKSLELLMDRCLAVFERNLIKFDLNEESQVFKFIQQKAMLSGATNMIALLKKEINKPGSQTK